MGAILVAIIVGAICLVAGFCVGVAFVLVLTSLEPAPWQAGTSADYGNG